MIPKLIHQTWNASPLPRPARLAVQRLRDQNPKWHHYLWTPRNVVPWIEQNYSLEYGMLYQSIGPGYGAVRSDFARCLLVYKLGGAYFDLKSGSHVPLDEVIRPSDRYLLSRWPPASGYIAPPDLPEGEFQNWYVIAEPGHPFLAAVIERMVWNLRDYSPAIHGVGKSAALRVTGPIAYTKAIRPIQFQHEHTWLGDDHPLRYKVFGGHTSILVPHYSHQTGPLRV